MASYIAYYCSYAGRFPLFQNGGAALLLRRQRKVFEFFRFLENEIFISILQKHGRKFAQAGITIGLQENGTV
jgi:hypothetical protein